MTKIATATEKPMAAKKIVVEPGVSSGGEFRRWAKAIGARGRSVTIAEIDNAEAGGVEALIWLPGVVSPPQPRAKFASVEAAVAAATANYPDVPVEWNLPEEYMTKPAPTAAAKNRCTACGVRPIGGGIGDEDKATLRSLKMCNPCATEGGWSNLHSDDAHETFETFTVKGSNFKTKAALDAWKAETRKATEQCWICHPELDASSADYVAREGTSREGMVVHARGGIDGKVACLKTAGETAGGTVEITEQTTGRGKEKAVISTTLVWRSRIGAELTVVWDDRGRFQYGPSVATGRISEDTPAKEAPRKIRNVAEALRFIASPV